MASSLQPYLFESLTPPVSMAIMSACGKYRSTLLRAFGDGPVLYLVLLNPSIADGLQNDPTVRKSIGFAKYNGFGTIVIENLVPYRATDPTTLVNLSRSELLGDEEKANEPFRRLPKDATVVAGWGMFPYNRPLLQQRLIEIKALLNRKLFCVRQTAGRPWHPLYVPYAKFQELNG